MFLGAPLAMGAGFEKSTLWSGKYQGISGAATSSASGAEALYFNPAGIVGGKSHQEATLNLSPTVIEGSAPVVESASRSETGKGFAILNGLFYRYKSSESPWAIGAGVYTAGGVNIQYNDVIIPGRPMLANARVSWH